MLYSIGSATFRTSPGYRLVRFEDLPPAQQQALSELQRDPDFYGILCPRADSFHVRRLKAVDRNTAELFLALQHPGPLPSHIKRTLKQKCDREVARLVLDGILEIEHNHTFSSGVAAYPLIYGQSTPVVPDDSPIARLSVQALQYAQALQIDDSATLSSRLYFYNRQPVTPYWLRRFPSQDAVMEYLDLKHHNTPAHLLERGWHFSPPPAGRSEWLVWKRSSESPFGEAPGATYKLYVSAHCRFLSDVFERVSHALAESDAIAFKMGANAYNLLRPDKMVIYFHSSDPLRRFAHSLDPALDGIPAHGVPFTAQIGRSSILSWGVDPPVRQDVLSLQDTESWRSWVTNRLAAALLTAAATADRAVEPWEFALQRLKLDGVDIATWTPEDTGWDDFIIGGIN